MTSKLKQREIDLLLEFEQFISDSKKGRRLQPNGRKISKGTICNYRFTLAHLQKFSTYSGWNPVITAGIRKPEQEKNYWKRFYRRFTAYLFDHCGFHDNYAGLLIKNLKVFFNYLKKERAIPVGDFYRLFYVPREEISIYPLMPAELQFLIADRTFRESLSSFNREALDFFVFGCTVALRFSDLSKLHRSNLRIVGDKHYLVVRSVKTNTASLIRLPQYAVEIAQRYLKRGNRLLPSFTLTRLNHRIKDVLEKAGFTQIISFTQNRRGVPAKPSYNNGPIRFCDHASSHTMRRTAITTMLSLGMPEQVVRKISGHSPSGRDFYRYVFWSQDVQDKESERVFEKLINPDPLVL